MDKQQELKIRIKTLLNTPMEEQVKIEKIASLLDEEYKYFNHYKDSALNHTKRINYELLPKIKILTSGLNAIINYKHKYYYETAIIIARETLDNATKVGK